MAVAMKQEQRFNSMKELASFALDEAGGADRVVARRIMMDHIQGIRGAKSLLADQMGAELISMGVKGWLDNEILHRHRSLAYGRPESDGGEGDAERPMLVSKSGRLYRAPNPDNNRGMYAIGSILLYPLSTGVVMENANRATLDKEISMHTAKRNGHALKIKFLQKVRERLENDEQTVGQVWSAEEIDKLREQVFGQGPSDN